MANSSSGAWWENTPASPLTLLGEFKLWDPTTGLAVWGPLSVAPFGYAPWAVTVPDAATLSASQPSRTSVALSWVAGDQTGKPPITTWDAQRRSSTDNGATYGAWAAITGSPFTAATRTRTDSGLATGTPELTFQYRVRANNGDGGGAWSNVVTLQWQGTPSQQPTAPTSLTLAGKTSTSRKLTWQETADATVTKHGVFEGGVLVVDNIDKTATVYDWTGLVPGSSHTNVGVARYNGQWSPSSNLVSFQQPTVDPTPVTMMMGVSDSSYDHGGTEVWDGWRIYKRSALYAKCNLTGNLRPKYVAYSVDGTPLGSAGNIAISTMDYATIYQYVLGELNAFYYTTDTGQTHSARWGIQLYWSNGNENSDKGILSTPHTQANIDAFVNESQRALYDAVHYIDPTTRVRRFPDAYAGSDPTHFQESAGIVADWLHPSAQYHDFVMWSMYPPGRDQTAADPTFNWPSLVEADRTKVEGFLLRCFYRTFLAQARARTDTGDSTRSLLIGCAEIGIGDDPNDSTTRPYYVVHGLAGGMQKLADQYSLSMVFATWWDSQKQGVVNAPQNRLSDEPVSTNPSTREAWQNWQVYNHQFGGTHPASWAGNPKPGWKTTGTVV